MNQRPVYCAGSTPAILFAKEYLIRHDIPILDSPQWNCGHLLLDVPSFRPGSPLGTGGNLDTLLSALPRDIIIWGGGLSHPSLEQMHTVDLLQDEDYLAQNAAITAHCAVQIAATLLPSTLLGCAVLITGWGRIGKCLAQLLKAMNANVMVAARKPADLAALRSLGYIAVDYLDINCVLPDIRLLFNTVPEMVLPEETIGLCQNCIKVDLASQRGIAGSDVVWARGLPGIHAPESSGRLIAKTMLRRMKEVTQ